MNTVQQPKAEGARRNNILFSREGGQSKVMAVTCDLLRRHLLHLESRKGRAVRILK